MTQQQECGHREVSVEKRAVRILCCAIDGIDVGGVLWFGGWMAAWAFRWRGNPDHHSYWQGEMGVVASAAVGLLWAAIRTKTTQLGRILVAIAAMSLCTVQDVFLMDRGPGWLTYLLSIVAALVGSQLLVDLYARESALPQRACCAVIGYIAARVVLRAVWLATVMLLVARELHSPHLFLQMGWGPGNAWELLLAMSLVAPRPVWRAPRVKV